MRTTYLAFIALCGVLVLPSCSSSTSSLSPSQPTAQARPSDFDALTGSPWTGTLTYLDYQSGKPTVLRTTLRVTRDSTLSPPAWQVAIGYPDEPKANSVEALRLSADGRTLDDEAVVERSELPGGVVRVVTQKQGQDDGRPATLRHVYVLGAAQCSVEKRVTFPGSAESIQRNIYRWSR